MSSDPDDGNSAGNDVSPDPTTSMDHTNLTSEKGKYPEKGESQSHEPGPGGLRISGIAQLGLNPSRSLLGTPYTSSHASPFEYPFPPSGTASTPTSQVSFSSSILSPSPLPVSLPLSLLPRSHSYPIGTGRINGLGLGFPIWTRRSTPQSSKLLSNKGEPPMPPGLLAKVSGKLRIISSPSATDFKDGEGTPKQSLESSETPDCRETKTKSAQVFEGETSHNHSSSSEAPDVG